MTKCLPQVTDCLLVGSFVGLHVIHIGLPVPTCITRMTIKSMINPPPKKEKNSNSSVQENLQNEHVCRYPQQHPK
jgi:hypothetical protein